MSCLQLSVNIKGMLQRNIEHFLKKHKKNGEFLKWHNWKKNFFPVSNGLYVLLL